MNMQNAFLDRITSEADPSVTWLVLADWLEDQGDPRSELVRLFYQPDHRRGLPQEQRAARVRKLLDSVPPLFENVLNAHFVWIPPGTFWMGGGGGSPGTRQVQITQGFALGVFPVTQGQWQAVMGKNPSGFSRDGRWKEKVEDIQVEELKQFPVEQVSWNDAQKFLAKLNGRETKRGSGHVYRLPSEAEWEYACRGGATSEEDCSYHFYLDQPTNDLSSAQANFNGRIPFGKADEGPMLWRPTRVGSYAPNKLGLYDMHGNVFEWCADPWDPNADPRMTDQVSLSEPLASDRVIRGGGWYCHGPGCRAAHRYAAPATSRDNETGLRLARVPRPVPGK